MEYKVITGKTLEQYKRKFRNCRRNLVYYTKDEVKEFDKKFGKENNFLLRGRTWCLIGNTYYEMPSLFTWTWFRNLNSTVQIFTCGILGVGVATAITAPLVLMNQTIEPEISISDVDKIEWSNKHYDKDGNAVITIKGKDGNVIRSFEISIDNYQLSEDDFTYNKITGELLIKKSCLDVHKGKIEIKPLFEEGSKKVTSIEVSSVGGVKELDNGSTLQFTAKVLPEDATIKDVEWSVESSSLSSNEINKDTGLFTAKTVGDFNIIAKAKDGSEVKGSAALKIKSKGTVTTGVSVKLDYSKVEVDDEFTATSSVLPENASDKSVTWISSDESVATIDKITGKIKGIKAGEVTIKAIANNGDNVVDQKTLTITDKVEYMLEMISGKATDTAGTEYLPGSSISFKRDLPYNKSIKDLTFSDVSGEDIKFQFYSIDSSSTKEYINSNAIVNGADITIEDGASQEGICKVGELKKLSFTSNGKPSGSSVDKKINVYSGSLDCNFVGDYNGWNPYDAQKPSYTEINKEGDIIVHHYLNTKKIISSFMESNNTYVNCIVYTDYSSTWGFKILRAKNWDRPQIEANVPHSENAENFIAFEPSGGNFSWKEAFTDNVDYEMTINLSQSNYIDIKQIDYLPVVYYSEGFDFTPHASGTSPDNKLLNLTPSGKKNSYHAIINELQNKDFKIQLYDKDTSTYVNQKINVVEGNGLVDNHDGYTFHFDTNVKHELIATLNNDTYILTASIVE